MIYFLVSWYGYFLHLFSGGGKGSFYCEQSSIKLLKYSLIKKAHAIGLDIRFGEDEDFSQASQQADELYSFIPEMNDGNPCNVSGLYPVKSGKEHPVIKKRIFNQGEKTFRYFEDRLISDINILDIPNEELSFFHDVKDGNGPDGDVGSEVLGSRNRWAVISMDGNDMGMQFRYQVAGNNPDKLSPEALKSWIQRMSEALDNCSSKAATAGIQKVVSEWVESDIGKSIVSEGKSITLPIRPLVVGGDDIVILCHSSYAMTFVKEATKVFEETSKQTPKLWPATNGRLTITAGVLYSSVSLPLHMAIPYSEDLLASAKTYGRKHVQKGKASPACIDWEQITETVIDTPAAKRQRELLFSDEDLGRNVKLTQRPYTLEEFSDLEKLAYSYDKVPSTVRHKILPNLSKSYAERLGFYAEVKKQHYSLFDDLNEFDKNNLGMCWKLSNDKTEQSTTIVDALMLLEENARMEKGV